MDLHIIILSEVSQTKTNIMQYCLYVDSKRKKKKKTQTYFQNRKRLTDIENKLTVTKVESGVKGVNWEARINIYTLLVKNR